MPAVSQLQALLSPPCAVLVMVGGLPLSLHLSHPVLPCSIGQSNPQPCHLELFNLSHLANLWGLVLKL